MFVHVGLSEDDRLCIVVTPPPFFLVIKVRPMLNFEQLGILIVPYLLILCLSVLNRHINMYVRNHLL
jgi:hypothetical protein